MKQFDILGAYFCGRNVSNNYLSAPSKGVVFEAEEVA